VGASLERVWENVHDWEHLPWLHGSSFSRIDLIDSGAWGWRATIDLQPPTGDGLEIELVCAPDAERYVTRTLSGPGAGTEIWTSLTPKGDDRTDVEVEFHVPGVEGAAAEAVGAAYARLYTILWDEDEAMMQRRAAALAGRAVTAAEEPEDLELGRLEELRARLPLIVELGRRRYRIVADGDDLVVHACDCPHRLGPLDAAPVANGRIRCPWHGYEFEIRGGASTDGRGLQLARAPRLVLDDRSQQVVLSSKALSTR